MSNNQDVIIERVKESDMSQTTSNITPSRSCRAIRGLLIGLTFGGLSLGSVNMERDALTDASTRLSVSQALAESAVPPPPMIIPNNLVSPEDQNLSPAEAKERALRYKAEATQAYKQGNYNAALRALQRAYLISQESSYIANIGLVFREMNRYEDAILALEYFLKTSPPPDKERAARQAILNLKPEVKISSQPEGAEIIIDDKPFGRTPITTRMLVGNYTLQLKMPSYESLKTTLIVLRNKPMYAQYKLERDFRADAPLAVIPSSVTRELTPMSRGQMSSVIAGGLALGAGVLTLALSRGALIERNQAQTRVAWSTAQREAELFGQIGYGASGLGLTALVGGLSWWLLSPRSERAREGDAAPSAPIPVLDSSDTLSPLRGSGYSSPALR